MPADPSILTPPAPSRPGQRVLRRLAKLTGWILLLLALVLAAAWHWRVRLANKLLENAVSGHHVQFEQLDWKDGAIQLRGLEMRPSQNDQQPWLKIPKATIGLDILKAPSGQLGRVVLERPEIIFKPEFLPPPADTKAIRAETPDKTPISSQALFSVEGFEIHGAKLRAESTSGEEFAAEIDWSGGELAAYADGSAEIAPQKMQLRHVRAGPIGAAAWIQGDSLDVEFSLARADRSLTIHHLRTEDWSGRATEAFWHIVQQLADAEKPDKGETKPTRPLIDSVIVEEALLGPLHLAAESLPWVPGLPPAQATITVRGEMAGRNHTGQSPPLKLHLLAENVMIGQKATSALIHTPRLSAELSGQLTGPWTVTQLALAPSVVQINAAALAPLGIRRVPIPESKFQISAELSGLALKPSGLQSSSVQKISVSQFSAARPGSEASSVSWEKLELEAVPDELISERRVRRLSWYQPRLAVSGADLAFVAPPAAAEETSAPPQQDTGAPAWEGWKTDVLEIRNGSLEAVRLGPGLPDAVAQFDATTNLRPDGGVMYELALRQIRATSPDLPKAPPIYRGDEIHVRVNPELLWSKRQIESLTFSGTRIHLGAREGDFEGPEEESPAPFAPLHTAETSSASESSSPEAWHIRETKLENTKIYLYHLIPDVAEVLVPLSHKTIRNLPLTEEGLRQSKHQERIELPLVYVPGTRPGTAVMDLDTNFVYFSLAGLMRRQIERIEMVNPKIYVGDSLFHYVNKIRSEAAAKPADSAALAQLGLAFVALLTDGEVAPPPAPDGWSIQRLRAINGKLISTVKDSPLFRVPAMPFGADSSLAEGKINADLAVPPGLYKPVLGLDLVAAVIEGRIVFNLPVKEKSNNLVQVFKAEWLRYKQFRISDVSLVVTFDANGVYCQFWAKGYNGELQGAFNLYLDDLLSWDMWLSGANVDMKPLTGVFPPNYFAMDGRLDFKLVAQGDKTSLYSASAECKNRTNGRIQIAALQDVIGSIPSDWGEAQRKWIIKALETLRDFAYTSCGVTLRFYGYDGKVELRLKGPDGERNFIVQSHDRRLRSAKPAE